MTEPDFRELVKLSLRRVYAECRRQNIEVCNSENFWLARIRYRTKESLRLIREIFEEPVYILKDDNTLQELAQEEYIERYLRTLACLGFVFIGAEKFSSSSYCLQQAMRTKKKKLFEYFSDFGFSNIKLPPHVYVDVVRYKLTDNQERLKQIISLAPIEAQIQYLIGPRDQLMASEALKIEPNEESLQSVLFLRDPYPEGWNQFQSWDTWPLTLYTKNVLDNLPTNMHSLSGLGLKAFRSNDASLFKMIISHFSKFRVIKAEEAKGISLGDPSEFKIIKTDQLFAGDPFECLEILFGMNSIPLDFIHDLLEACITANAPHCFRFLYKRSLPASWIDEQFLSYLRLSIISSNLYAFRHFRDPNYCNELKRSLILCKAPEIWKDFLIYSEVSELPPIPKDIRKYL